MTEFVSCTVRLVPSLKCICREKWHAFRCACRILEFIHFFSLFWSFRKWKIEHLALCVYFRVAAFQSLIVLLLSMHLIRSNKFRMLCFQCCKLVEPTNVKCNKSFEKFIIGRDDQMEFKSRMGKNEIKSDENRTDQQARQHHPLCHRSLLLTEVQWMVCVRVRAHSKTSATQSVSQTRKPVTSILFFFHFLRRFFFLCFVDLCWFFCWIGGRSISRCRRALKTCQRIHAAQLLAHTNTHAFV